MTAADERMEELLDRWMASLELHSRYLQLDDAAYARAEKWPRHQRPTKWVVDLARKRLVELRALLTQRKQLGDPAFAEALELMAFLTGLLGSEHLERFIPLATGKAPDTAVSGTVEQPRPRAAKAKASTTGHTGTNRPPAVQQKQAPAQRATTPRSTPPTPVHSRRAMPDSPVAPSTTDAKVAQVVADAVRMLEWGREWPALAGLIARMADRPSEAEVWKILRAHRAEIMAKAHRPND